MPDNSPKDAYPAAASTGNIIPAQTIVEPAAVPQPVTQVSAPAFDAIHDNLDEMLRKIGPSEESLEADASFRAQTKPNSLLFGRPVSKVFAIGAMLVVLIIAVAAAEVLQSAGRNQNPNSGDSAKLLASLGGNRANNNQQTVVNNSFLQINRNTIISDAHSLTTTGNVLVQSTINSADALKIQNSAGNNILVADTKNNQINIGNKPPGDVSLNVSGDITTNGSLVSTGNYSISSQGLSIGGVLICSANGCISSASPTNNSPPTIDVANVAYINTNQTITGANSFTNPANSFTGSGSGLTNLNASNIASGTLADNRLSGNIAKLSANQTFTGNNLFKGDGTGLFEVQDSAATNLFVANTSDMRVAINQAVANYTLDVNGDINTTSVFRINGTVVCDSGGCVPSSGSNNYVQLQAGTPGTAQTGNFNISGTALAGSFSGSGLNLTNLDASQVASGTLNDLRLSNNVTLQGNTFNGASQLVQTTGLSYLPALNGSLVTNLNASSLASGTLNDLRLSANVALLNAASQTFSGDNIFSNMINAPGLETINNGHNIAVSFSGTSTGALSYNFDNTAAPGTYFICTTIGNCTSGGNVSTAGGTTNKLAKFTAGTTIGDSIISDNGTIVSVAGELDATTIKQNSNTVCDISGNCAGVGGQVGTSGTPTSGTVALFTGVATIGDSIITQAAGTIGVAGNFNLTGASSFQLNGVQVTSGILSNDSNLAKLDGTQAFTGVNTFKNTGTDAFLVQKADGSGNSFIIDTSNTRVGIGVQPAYTLDVAGDINISTGSTFKINGVSICGPSATCAPSAGSTNYIQNGVTLQSSANFNIQSTATGSIVGILQGKSGQTADILDLKDGNGNLINSVNSTGSVLVQTSTNSTTAFQIQNAAGTSNLFIADTTNTRLGIGAAPANSLLTIGTNTTTSAGGITLGTDTNLYRSGVGALKTDGSLETVGGLFVGGQATITRAASGNTAIATQATGDTQKRLNITANGDITWGSGSAVGDTSLYRSAVNTLRTDSNFIGTGTALFKNSADSTTAFQLQNAAGTSNLLVADTTDTRIGIGTAAPLTTLNVNGTGLIQGTSSSPSTLTMSGNEITDATRTANTQGDGTTPPDSSTGIWEGTTNLITNGGFESNTTGWTNDHLPTVTRDSTTSKFGTTSLKIVTPGTFSDEGVHYSPLAMTAGQKYTLSFWAKNNGTATSLDVSFDNRPAGGTLQFTTLALTSNWARYTYTITAAETTATAIIGIDNNVATARTYWIDGAQIEQKAFATPYVETNGSTASRAAAEATAPASLLSETQGWVAMRVRMGVSSSNVGIGGGPWGWTTFGVPTNSFAAFAPQNNTGAIRFSNVRNGTQTNVNLVQTWNAGDLITIVMSWTNTSISASINGANFTSNNSRGAAGGAALPGTFNIGDTQSGNNDIDADFLWLASGTGTLTNADAANINALGNTDPYTTNFSQASYPSMVWHANTSNYQTPTSLALQVQNATGSNLFNVNSASTSLTANASALFQNSTNSTTAFQVQNAAGTSNLLVADTTNTRVGIGAAPANSLLTVGTNTTTASGGITFGTDTNLYRSGIGGLTTTGSLNVGGNILGNQVFASGALIANLNLSSQVQIGYLQQSALGGAGARSGIEFGSSGDTNIYRNAAGALRTDSTFQIGGAAAGGGTPSTNSTTAFQVQNAAGTSILNVNTTGQSVSFNQLATPGIITPTLLSAPVISSITQSGTGGATSYSYKVSAVFSNGYTSAVSAVSTTGGGNAVLTSINKNNINWSTVGGATGYNIYRTASSGNPSTTGLIGSIGDGSIGTFSDTGLAAIQATPAAATLSNGTTYYYKVTALDNIGNETAASAETSQAVSAANQAVGLSWSAVAGARSYRVYRGTSSGAENVYFKTNTNNYTDYGTGSSTSATPPSVGTAYGSILTSAGNAQITIGGTGSSTGQLYLGGNVAAPITVTTSGVAGTTNWIYQVSGVNAAGNLLPPPYGIGFTNTGNSSLSGSNFNTISWAAIPGAASYNVYRSTGVTAQGFIANTASTTLNDTGLSASGSIPSSAIGSLSLPSNNVPHVSQGRYAYIPSNTAGIAFRVVDASDPSNPALIGSAAGTAASAISVSGRYVYTANSAGTMQIFDVANESNPTLLSTTNMAFGANVSETAQDMVVSGRYVYVIVSGTSNSLEIFDAANPASPTLIGSLSLSASGRLTISGKYVYIGIMTNPLVLETVDISNPSAPTVTSNYSTNPSSSNFQGMFVQGRYLYGVVGINSKAFQVYDISNAASPQLVSSQSNLTTNGYFVGNRNLSVQGRFAYTTTQNGNPGDMDSLETLDISNPLQPVIVGITAVAHGSRSLSANGRYLYVLSSGIFQVFDLGGEYAQSLEAGSAELNGLSVNNDANFGADVSIQGAIGIGGSLQTAGSIGAAGNLFVQGVTSIAGGILGGVTVNNISVPSAPTVTPTGTAGSTSYSYTVTAVGAGGGETTASAAGTTATGNATLDSTNFNRISWPAVAGATAYKVYRTVAAGTSPTTLGLIGTTSATTLDDTGLAGSGVTSPTVNTSGQLMVQGTALFKNSTDSTTSFQIQNSSGTGIFIADTTSTTITLGPASSTPVILVLGNKNSAGDPTCTAGAIYYNSNSNTFRGCISGTWYDFAVGASAPSGSMMEYAGATAPTGYLLADGSAVSRTTYAALFAIIGTTYGVGDGSTTFNLPDMRGRTPVGLNTSESGHSDVNALGNNDGTALASRTPKHNSTVNDPGHSHTIYNFFGGGATNSGALCGCNNAGGTTSTNSATTGITVGPGGSRPTDTASYLTVNYIIKF